MRCSEPATGGGAAVLALLLADSRTPAGGFAHSGGLEAAVEGGLSAAGLPAFLAARLETTGFVDAAFAAAACGAAAPALLALDEQLAARCPSAPLRAAARQLGRALLRLGASVWPADATLAAYARESAWTPRPVAFGALAHAAGLDPLATARSSLYEDAAGVAAAAVKLLPLDAAATTAWLAALAPRIEALAAAAAGSAADPPPDLPATAAPLLDLRSLHHDRSDRRLFVT
ncbi:MAG TPA: urease accessory UreF family protein [Conexibacter sp.]|nr:urease accessory UreF family protein [Conexibacter sp.]